MKRIIVGVDGSEGANRAAGFAAQLAEQTGAALELVHVYDAPTAVELGLRALTKEQLSETGEYVAKGSVEAAEKAIGGRVPVEHHFALGHPAEEIVTRAKETDADLIVIGSRGLGTLKGLLLGSVSKQIVELAERPVTVVP